jgi:outer membrane receptor protein involved in Fe transport
MAANLRHDGEKLALRAYNCGTLAADGRAEHGNNAEKFGSGNCSGACSKNNNGRSPLMSHPATRIFPRSLLAIGIAAAALPSATTLAQDTAPGSDFALDEVVVTAQKRTENLQQVPISVAVTSGEKLEEANIVNLEALTQYTPNFYVAENPIGNYIIVRGVGSQTNQGIEQEVGIYADGIYRGRMQQGRTPFLDLDSTQVLRGPQSILFGKNTIGGAVILNSRLPTKEFEASLQGTYQIPNNDGDKPDYEGYEATAVVSGPLSDTVGARLAVRDYHADGYMQNVITGKEDPERDETTVRTVFTFTPNDAFDVFLRYEHSEFDSVGRNSQQISDYPFDWEREVANNGRTNDTLTDFQNAAIDALTPAERNAMDNGESSDTTLDEVALKLELVDGDFRYVSITGYSTYEYDELTDVDFVATPLIGVDATEEYTQWSQELRLEKTGGNLEYTAGVYWQTSEIDYEEANPFAARIDAQNLIPESLQSLLLANVVNATRSFNFDQDADTYAAFAETRWHIRDDLTLITGLRYTYESKTATHDMYYHELGNDATFTCSDNPALGTPKGNYCQLFTGYLTQTIATLAETLFGAGSQQYIDATNLKSLGTFEHNFDEKRSEDQWTPSVKLQYMANDDTMFYGSLSSGFKGGGFDGRILVIEENQFEYDNEQALSVEIGGKTTIADGTAEINAAIFYTEIDDLQVSTFDGYTGFVVGNAAKMRTQGVETDARWLAAQWLTVMGSVAYLDARFTDFEDAGCTNEQFNAYEAAHPGDRAKCSQDMSGERVFLAPEWTSSLAFITVNEISDTLLLNGGLDFNFRDNYFLDADNDEHLVQHAFTLINARIGISNADDTWEIALLGKNLTDKVWSPNGTDIPLTDGKFFKLTSPPRTFALQVSVKI